MRALAQVAMNFFPAESHKRSPFQEHGASAALRISSELVQIPFEFRIMFNVGGGKAPHLSYHLYVRDRR
jgi:hypothetical protein